MASGQYDDLQISGRLNVRGIDIPTPSSLGGGGGGDLSVNAAGADVGLGGLATLRTGASVNPAGAYNGGGTGNKAFLGYRALDGLPISTLTSIEYTFRSSLGPGGPFYNPPGAGTVVTPYINLLVNFGAGDLRVLSLIDDSLAGAITAAIGTYANPGGLNTLVYGWSSALDVLIVNSPPNAVPGGVAPHISVGPTWPENSYSWAALVAANPAAVFVNAFPGNAALFPNGDGGMPVGATMPAMLLVSGDSGNVTKSGKQILTWKVNGLPLG